MDAAYNTLKKTALFLSIALLLAAPFAAQAQQFTSGLTAVVNGNQPGCVTVTSTGAAITFTVTQPNTGPQFTISPTSGTTPEQVCFLVSNPGIGSGTQDITMTLTATSPSGVSNGTITVVFNPGGGSSGGGNGNGASVSSNSLAFVYPNSTSFSLTSTVSSGTVSYNTGISYQNCGSGWLTLGVSNGAGNNNTAGSGFLNPGNSQQFVVSGNTNSLPNGTCNAVIAITLSGAGSGGINIPVAMSVGGGTGGNGTLTANPNPINLNYTTGSNQAPFQAVTLTSSTGATTYDASVTQGQTWLLVNGQTQSFGQLISGGISVTTILGNLPTSNSQGQIQVTDSNGNTLAIPVNFTINGTTNGLTISPSPVTLNAATGSTANVSTNVTVSSSLGGSLQISNISGTGISASLSGTNIIPSGTQTLTITGNPTNLAANTYQGSVTVTLNGTTSTTVNVYFVVGNGSGNTSGGIAPTSLQFNAEQNFTTSLVSQTVVNGVTGNFSISSISPSNSWLQVSPASGTGPANISVSVSGISGLPLGNNTGSFQITTPNGTQTVNVSLFIASSTVVFAANGQTVLTYTAGNANPTTTFQVLSSDGTAVAISGATSSQSWLTVQQLNSTTPASFFVTANGAALVNGVNAASLTITSSAANSQLVVPIVVTASGNNNSGAILTATPSSLTFPATSGSSTPLSSSLTITASANLTYSATASTTSGGNWLSVSPSSSSLSVGSNTILTVTANPAGLSNGTYNGSISLVANGITQPAVPVTLTVGSGGGGGGGNTGALTVSPSTLTFNYQQGGTTPSAQGFNVSSTSGTVSYTVATTTVSGGNWLSTNAQSTNFTPGNISVSVNPTGLTAGQTYTGTVTLTSGSNQATVGVTLVVQGLPTVSAGPASIALSYQSGSSTTPTATVNVTGNAANLNFTASTTSNPAGWLSVSPTTGSTGTNGTTLQVTTNPSGLNPGNYSGTITVAGTSGATGNTTINVTLAVTAPLPTIQAVVNAASGLSGPVSPGEIVSIFGPASNPIGPGTPASLTLDSNGNVSTTLAGVQVLFGGIPAPLTYVSSTQINAVVPYGIAGLFAPFAQVRYLNQGSNAFSLTTTSTAPGIFAQGPGTGIAAALNQDGSVNSATHPAPKGSVVVIYATGEGQTTPPGVTGKVTCSNCTVDQLPKPLLPVTVTLIDSNNVRYPCNFQYAGEAPGLVSGVLQVNMVVPTTVPSGTLQLVIGVGSNTSQPGVTIVVQ